MKKNNNFGLKQQYIKKILRETLECMVDKDDTPLKVEDYFDINKIDRKKILSIASDMRAFIGSQGYGSQLSTEGELLFEEMIKTLPIKQLRNELSNLGFKQWQIKSTIFANHVRVVILYVDMAKNTDVITNEMATFGWSRARISEPTVIEGVTCRVMDFDPIQQKIMNKEARKFECLYHWSPEHNVASIMNSGINTRSDNDFFSYPPKAHFMKGNISEQNASYLGWQLYNKNKNLTNGNYVLFQINMNDVPDNIDFFGDPRFKYGYYAKETIPSSALEVIGKITYTDKNKYNYESIENI